MSRHPTSAAGGGNSQPAALSPPDYFDQLAVIVSPATQLGRVAGVITVGSK
jgi:hypothetical protein